MKIIAYELGRIIQFVNLDEILPLQGVYLPDILPLITQRYSFMHSPNLMDPIENLRETGLKFTAGKFQDTSEVKRMIKEFTIFPDGLSISALKTDDANSFLEDIFVWGQQEIGLRPESISTDLKVYVSEIVIEFEIKTDRLIHKMTALSELIGNKLKSSYGNEFPPVTVTSLKFDYDKALAPASFYNLTNFAIERRSNHRFTDNAFYCQAPLPTADHVEVLELVESILKS